MRCFVAIELESKTRHAIARFLREKLPGSRDVRWCGDEQLHITLKFLGDVAESDVPAVCAAVEAASEAVRPFTIRLQGFGVFPPHGAPRVLWCGVEDPEVGAAHWVAAVEPRLLPLGIEPESRPYTPHLTLGRSKGGGGGAVLKQVQGTAVLPATPEMRVERVTFFESRLQPGGAVHVPLMKAALGAKA